MSELHQLRNLIVLINNEEITTALHSLALVDEAEYREHYANFGLEIDTLLHTLMQRLKELEQSTYAE